MSETGIPVRKEKFVRPLVKEKIFAPNAFFPQCHASTLVRLGNGDILAAWFAGTHEKHPDTAIWISTRRGGLWSDPVKITHEENIPCWNPVLFEEQGIIYLFYKVGKAIPSWYSKWLSSSDMGESWQSLGELVPGDRGGRGPVKNKPICLDEGSWLAPASLETEERWDCFCDISQDKGLSWKKSSFVPLNHGDFKGKGLIQPTLWESEPGIIHMLMRSTEGFIYRSDSADNGRTWCAAYPTIIPNNNSGLDLVMVNEGPRKGTLVLIYNPVKGNWAARTPLSYTFSADNGQSWTEPVDLDHNANPLDREDGEFSYPAVISHGEKIFLTYTWKRRSVVYVEL